MPTLFEANSPRGYRQMSSPYFFLHIPRTAGTTLNSILEGHFAPEEILKFYEQADYRKHRYHTSEIFDSIRLVMGHILLGGINPPSLFGVPVRVLTFLREPVARLASEYEFQRSWKQNHLYSFLNENGISFGEYIRSTEKFLYYRGKNFMTRCISHQSDMEGPYPEKALAIAKENLEKHFVFFGIQERFAESLLMLGDLLGISNLLHDKRNVLKEDSRMALSAEDLATAREFNRADIELYEFACGLFEERVKALGPEFPKRVKDFVFLNGKFQKVSRLLQQRSEASEHGNLHLPKDGRW